jgi:Ca2+-binding RTX toxin-like protein
VIFGNSGDDDIIGGHNVDRDQNGGLAYDGDDRIDAGAGDDVVLGDNGTIYRTFVLNDPRIRMLEGTLIYGITPGVNDGTALITDITQLNPDMTVQRLITIFDHGDNANPLEYGSDIIAGGAEDDMIFGQMGDDIIQGDGTTDFIDGIDARASRDPVTGLLNVNPSIEDYLGVGRDGDDYIEGNGGNDVIFGNLGQDDIIGGSSNLFVGLDGDNTNRPDGSDLIFGGAGTAITRNDLGDESATGHARDADTIVGDNGNIFRLIGAGGAYLTFNYDIYSTDLRIIPRAVELLDYTNGGTNVDPSANFNNRGTADEIHGEAGDDTIYGQRGNDALFGDGQSDDIIGGIGDDWISGGTGADGVIGDDGRIMTSRNSTLFGEPLNGIAVLEDYNNLITTASFDALATVTNVPDELRKTVNLVPFSTNPNDPNDRNWASADSDDIIFGGWGDDFLHGGAGNDAISGAEALPISATPRAMDGTIISFDTPVNNGNGIKYVASARSGDPLMTFFDPSDPRGQLHVGSSNFFLNFDHTEGQIAVRSENGFASDGDDMILGGTGNDALMGGTGRDQMYGGYGNDYLNADDNQLGDSNRSDDDISYEDFSFGGAGEDIMIANNVGDRLIDWNGEFNSYYTPFQSVGEPTVINDYSLELIKFIYVIGANAGADPTRFGDIDVAGLTDDLLPIYLQGEPFGELGIVVSEDAKEYSKQSGENRFGGRGAGEPGEETQRIAPIPTGFRLNPSSTSNTGLISADRVLVQGAVDAITILARLEVLQSIVDGTSYITLIEALADAGITPTTVDQAFTYDQVTGTFTAIPPVHAPFVAGDEAAIEILNASGEVIAYYTGSSEIYVIDDTLDNPEAQSDLTVDDWIYLGPAAAIGYATTLPLTLMGVLR